jgi:hypothetical protein
MYSTYVMLVYVSSPVKIVPHTYVGFLAIIDQFLLAVLLLLHRPHLRLTQKQGNIGLTENGVQLNIKKQIPQQIYRISLLLGFI